MCVGAVMYCGGERRQSTHLRHIPRPSVVHARTAGIPMQQNKPVLNDFILSRISRLHDNYTDWDSI